MGLYIACAGIFIFTCNAYMIVYKVMHPLLHKALITPGYVICYTYKHNVLLHAYNITFSA